MRYVPFGPCLVLLAMLGSVYGDAAATAVLPSEPSSLEEVLRMIPADAHGAVVIPHLKRASDHLTRMLEGMDRAGLLLGSRPIDHFKSITGFATAVDDHGTAALVVMDARAETSRIALLVPVTSAEEFLAANFTAVEGQADARRSADGRIVYARGLQSHVLLSADAQTILAYDAETGGQSALPSAIVERRPATVAEIDAIVIARPAMISALQQRVLNHAAELGWAWPAVTSFIGAVTGQISEVVHFVQFDPLAMIVRSAVEFRQSSAIGAAAPVEAPPDEGLARLPGEPAALALSVNLAALGGPEAWAAMARQNSVDPDTLPAWLGLCESLQLRVERGPAGPAGGLLNGAWAVLAGSDPTAIRDALKREILTGSNPPATVRESKWNDGPSLSDGSKAAAFEARSVNPTPAQAMLESILFGPSGLRGYVATAADSVIITCSQRPALLAQANAAARQPPDAGFASDAAVKVMRQWMPEQRDVEGYAGMAQVAEMLRSLAGALPEVAEAIPTFEATLPPVGFALDVSPHRVDGSLIVPAGVLSHALDAAMRGGKAPEE